MAAHVVSVTLAGLRHCFLHPLAALCQSLCVAIMPQNRQVSEHDQNAPSVSLQPAAAIGVECIFERLTPLFPNETNSLNSCNFVCLISTALKTKVTAASTHSVYWNDQPNFSTSCE